jgi:hypothetical protein
MMRHRGLVLHVYNLDAPSSALSPQEWAKVKTDVAVGAEKIKRTLKGDYESLKSTAAADVKKARAGPMAWHNGRHRKEMARLTLCGELPDVLAAPTCDT